MNEPIDVQKTLAAYGAELDELRVWCRKQEERIAELEKQLALETARRKASNSATREMFGQHGERLTELEDIAQTHGKVLVQLQTPPGAALEARPAPVPEYAPGWVDDKPPYFDCGLGARDFTPPHVEFKYTQSDNHVTLCVQSDDGDDYAEVELDVLRMKEFVGAAMAILKRMEGE